MFEAFQGACFTLLSLLIALLHDDVTIKTFIKILLFDTRDHGRLEGTKQRKFTENRYGTGQFSFVQVY